MNSQKPAMPNSTRYHLDYMGFPCQAGTLHDAVAKRDLAALERVLKALTARCR